MNKELEVTRYIHIVLISTVDDYNHNRNANIGIAYNYYNMAVAYIEAQDNKPTYDGGLGGWVTTKAGKKYPNQTLYRIKLVEVR